MNDYTIEEFTLPEAQKRFKHSCKTCEQTQNYGTQCSLGHRIKDILIIRDEIGQKDKITYVRKKGGCEDYIFNWG